ncbi:MULTISPECIES: GntR family transcriptional regulator [Pacificimonas]|uniref:GntR family transcriptional regulator n=1 Tax=Pacificimonas aurantium TaxID=1250540 RepID=A0ABS7WPR3_9SPHN|nr:MULTISPECIES: GntR family transcriptional regulator [Pacificimonas]MBZ6379593.1 GntR family transcriptional regulator [Pacificimonas aurantium]
MSMRTHAVDEAYGSIRAGIASGSLEPGAHLTADRLAESIGASRTPVREALRRLAAEGLVQLIPNRGAFVSEYSAQDIRQIYELRILLESFAAASAAENADDANRKRLRFLAEEISNIVQAESPDLERVALLNSEFHRTLIEACGNPRLGKLLASLTEYPLIQSTFRRYGRDGLLRSARQHLELVTAIEDRDAEWARAVMISHIRSAKHALVGPGPEEQGDAA